MKNIFFKKMRVYITGTFVQKSFYGKYANHTDVVLLNENKSGYYFFAEICIAQEENNAVIIPIKPTYGYLFNRNLKTKLEELGFSLKNLKNSNEKMYMQADLMMYIKNKLESYLEDVKRTPNEYLEIYYSYKVIGHLLNFINENLSEEDQSLIKYFRIDASFFFVHCDPNRSNETFLINIIEPYVHNKKTTCCSLHKYNQEQEDKMTSQHCSIPKLKFLIASLFHNCKDYCPHIVQTHVKTITYEEGNNSTSSMEGSN